MDPFVLVLVVAFVVFVAAILLLGVYYPGSGLEQLGMRSAREITETREELEAQDLDQMLAAHNARRAAKGENTVSADEMELRIRRDFAEQLGRREQYRADQRGADRPGADQLGADQPGADQRASRKQALADQELDELLAATNARRRKRGLPERTRAQAAEELGRSTAPPSPGEPSSAPPREG